MKALYVKKSFDFQIRETEPRRPGQDEVLVEVRGCGLCGTDLHFARDWSQDYAPLGHEIAAEVVEVGAGNVPYRPGDRVIVEDVAQCGICEDCKAGKTHLCRNMFDLQGQPGMAETMTVNYHLLNRFEDIPWTVATLTEPMAVAYNTVLNANIPLGGNVVVMGPGPIGLMCVHLAKMNGAGRVVLVGSTRQRARGKARLEAGAALGADFLIEAQEEDPVKRVKEIFSAGADSLVVTSPPQSLPQAVQCTRFGGTVSFIGIDLGGRSRVELDVNELVFNKISLIPTFAEPARSFPDTLRILKNKLFDAGKILSRTFSFADAEEIFRKSDSGEEPIIKAVFVP